jgi:hypothetical protein
MTTDYALITAEDAALELRSIPDELLVAALLEECSAEIETVLDRQVVTRGNITEYHSVRTCTAELYLRFFPILNVVSVHEDSNRLYTNAALTEGTDYVVNPEIGKLTRISGDAETSWLTGREAVRVVWSGGYAQAGVPGDLKRIAKEFVALKAREIVGQLQGQASIGDGLGTRSMYGPAELTSHMLNRLARHRNYDAGRDTRSRWSVAAP